MDKFDKFIKSEVSKSEITVPDAVKEKIEESLTALPERKKQKHRTKTTAKIILTAASFALVLLVVFPNVSGVYAQALEKIPVISSIVKVFTIRNYSYSDKNHEMDINVPQIEDQSNDAADYINKDVDELTKMLADRFNEELEALGNSAHTGIYVDYNVVTNTDCWFTLKVMVHEAAGSSNTYYKYYHINKLNEKIVKLGDVVENDEFYDIVKEEIKRQMRQQMKNDDGVIYWVEDAPFGDDFSEIDGEHNFYWNESCDLVIAFDKYEVAPGAMGTPEFTISKDLILDYIKDEYKNIIEA